MIFSNFRRMAAIAAMVAATAATGCSSTHEAIGQANGALNANYSAAYYAPNAAMLSVDRYPRVSESHMQRDVSQHVSQPAAR